MAEDIKGLLEKIQEEGVKNAQEKAREIEAAAEKRAQEIIAKAQAQANKILADAQTKSRRFEENATVALKQAGRDLLLEVRRQLDTLLDKLTRQETKHVLGKDELARLITGLVKTAGAGKEEEITVSLSEKDYDALGKEFMSRLAAEAKKGVTLKPTPEIAAGFTISYDAGKSHFDFTDKALAEYVWQGLKPRLAEILKQALEKS